MRMNGGRLAGLVQRFARVRVLVVGDLMLDQFVWGRVERISPEAPVPVVHVTDEDVRPGGAGNVVSNVMALGGRAAVSGIVGADAAGKRLAEALGRLGASTEGVVVSRHGPTTQKTRIIAHQQQVVRLDREVAGTPDGAGARRVRDFVLGHRRDFDVVVVSDYAKGAVGAELLAGLAAARARETFICVVDPKRANFDHYRRASLMKPNRGEAADAAGIEIGDRRSLRTAGARLLERWQADAVLISRGEEGMALFKPGGVVREFPTVAREVFDVTGAGDTVLATCALALGAGGTLEEATVLANHAAGIVVGKIGTATVTAREILATLAESDAARDARERRTGPGKGRPTAEAVEKADGVRGHRKGGARGAREHWTGPGKGRPTAEAVEKADGVRGHRKGGARGAREHWTGPGKGRPTAEAVEKADGVRGHRKGGARGAREHWTGPRKN
jgi:rfaE bifunctional protein kinase chain/domain